MNRTLLVLCLGLVCGLAAHAGWYALHRPAPVHDLAGQLAWMRSNLQLSEAQFARIRSLHEQSSPRLVALAMQVTRLRAEFAAFEHERKSTGEVDFLEFARFVEQRRTVDRECAESTRRLILAAADVMTPEQRQRYLALLGPALKSSGTSALN
ncbi:MAG: hypothetical protein HZA31_08165 [Opitutae bacterium]|nr:hypothetical protein [Opitutae bacterium]